MKAARWLVGLWVLLLPVSVFAARMPTVTEIQVRGTLRVEPALILQKIKSRVGEPYNPDQVREDIQAIYSLGFFRDVEVELDDHGRLTFVVVERPALREWKAEGAKGIDKEDLSKAVPLKKREILEEEKVDEGARGIRNLYREKGYYLAEVRAEIKPVPGGKNQVDVIYRVTEGEKVKVKDLNLLGVTPSDDKDIRKKLDISEAGMWSWLTGSGKFTDSDLEHDREMIRSYYLNHGYAEVKVLDPLVKLTADRRWLRIDIPVEEGATYRIGQVTFSGDLKFPLEKLRKAARIKKGELFRSDDYGKGIQNLSDLYADIGYAFAEVDPVTRLDREHRTISVDYEIHKGDLIHIGRIEVRGNTKTRDRVVRREMRIAEGDLYNGTAIRKSRQRIENLGFFEKVNLTTKRRPGTNLVDVDVEVEEKATGAFSVGGGYSSVDKIVGMASVSQRNFLGLGYQLALAANVGSSTNTYSFTFNNPRLFDSEVYGGLDLYKSLRSYQDYDKNALGGDVKIGFPIGEYWRTRTTYLYEDAKVSNVSATASTFIKDQLGKTITSAVSQAIIYDTRDNRWEPHGGMLAQGSVEWAGWLLGGDAAYLKYDLEASKYVPLWWRHVLTLHTDVGLIQGLSGGKIPIYDRYYLGGISSLRGFASLSVGPKDPKTGDVIGGDKMFLFNVEYLFPLIEQAKVRGVLFFDAGNAWDVNQTYFSTKLRTDVGAGIRWVSPLGPLRLEWGYNLQPEPDERRSRWQFSVGGFF